MNLQFFSLLFTNRLINARSMLSQSYFKMIKNSGETVIKLIKYSTSITMTYQLSYGKYSPIASGSSTRGVLLIIAKQQ